MHKMLRPDAKGRITLGSLAKGVSGFTVIVNKDRTIILEPYSEIPAREKWLFENKIAMEQVTQGLKDSKIGRVSKRGSFAEFANEDDDE